jgi:hypothetical protein
MPKRGRSGAETRLALTGSTLVDDTTEVTIENIVNYIRDKPMLTQMVWRTLELKTLETSAAKPGSSRKLAPCQNKFVHGLCPYSLVSEAAIAIFGDEQAQKIEQACANSSDRAEIIKVVCRCCFIDYGTAMPSKVVDDVVTFLKERSAREGIAVMAMLAFKKVKSTNKRTGTETEVDTIDWDSFGAFSLTLEDGSRYTPGSKQKVAFIQHNPSSAKISFPSFMADSTGVDYKMKANDAESTAELSCELNDVKVMKLWTKTGGETLSMPLFEKAIVDVRRGQGRAGESPASKAAPVTPESSIKAAQAPGDQGPPNRGRNAPPKRLSIGKVK